MRSARLEARNAVNRIYRQSKAVHLVQDGKLHRRIDVALLLIAADVQIVVICPPIGEPMNKPWIGMEIENDVLVGGEQCVEFAIGQPVRML